MKPTVSYPFWISHVVAECWLLWAQRMCSLTDWLNEWMDECLEPSCAFRMWPSRLGFHPLSQATTVEDLAGSMKLPTLPDPTEVTNRRRDGWLPTDTVKWTKTSVVFRLPVWHLAAKWNRVWNTPVLSSLLTGRALIAKGREGWEVQALKNPGN